MLNIVTLAKEIAYSAHAGQFRRNGLPYFMHPYRVSEKFSDSNLKIIAFLHDVLEDTSETERSLIHRGIPSKLVDIVKILKRSDKESYSEYIRRIKSNELAKKVKIQDMIDNLYDSPSTKQIHKYAKALNTLSS